MSVADLLPDAPLNCVDATDWWMYLDILSESDQASKLQLDTVRSIAQSLHRCPLLIPVMAFTDGLDRLITPFEPYLTQEPLRLAGPMTRCASWIRAEWISPAAYFPDGFKIMADPWGHGNSHPFAIMMAMMRDPSAKAHYFSTPPEYGFSLSARLRWWNLFRDRFFGVHAIDRPDHHMRFSIVDEFGLDGEFIGAGESMLPHSNGAAS